MPSGKTVKSAGCTDWQALRDLPDHEIERMAAEDEDNPATLGDDAWAQAKVGLPPRKAAIHATFDRDVVDFFKREGRGYQTRMNAVLRRNMEAQQAKKIDR